MDKYAIKVVNKDYAPDALAWTYNMTKEEYQPIKET